MMLSSAISIVLSKEIQIPRIIILSVGSIIAIIHTQPYVFITIFNQCFINDEFGYLLSFLRYYLTWLVMLNPIPNRNMVSFDKRSRQSF